MVAMVSAMLLLCFIANADVFGQTKLIPSKIVIGNLSSAITGYAKSLALLNCICMYMAFKRIKLENPGCSGF